MNSYLILAIAFNKKNLRILVALDRQYVTVGDRMEKISKQCKRKIIQNRHQLPNQKVEDNQTFKPRGQQREINKHLTKETDKLEQIIKTLYELTNNLGSLSNAISIKKSRIILNRQKSTTILRTDTEEVKSTIVLEKWDCLLYIKKQIYILNSKFMQRSSDIYVFRI